MNQLTYCSACVLPNTFPNINFDADGVCNFCRNNDISQKQNTFDLAPFNELVEAVRNKSDWDALVCYSGGKDSTFILQWLKESYNLNILSFTLDNGFLADTAKSNINYVTSQLGVDHIFFKPSMIFQKKMFQAAMTDDLNRYKGSYQTRISDTCLSCISLVNNTAVKLSIRFRIPLILAGFTPGQVPKSIIQQPQSMTNSHFEAHRDHYEKHLGKAAESYMKVPETDNQVYLVSPFLMINYNESDILNSIKHLGWDEPDKIDGCTSNCRLNGVGNLIHMKRYGFHPYALELSILVRNKMMTREHAFSKLQKNIAPEEVNNIIETLDISQSAIK